ANRKVHAEMSAIEEYLKQVTGGGLKALLTAITEIEVSSPPCPRCTVVLRKLGLEDKIITRRGHQKESAGWCYPVFPGLDWVKLLSGGIKDVPDTVDGKKVLDLFSRGNWAGA